MTIISEEDAPWWVITIEGPQGFRRMLFVEPQKQDPESNRDSVQEALGR